MTPYFTDPWLTLYQGDCRDVLPTLPDASVDCVVTSPPYWGLRDYGTATWIGGDADCDHLQGPLISSSSTLAGYTSETVQVRTQGIPFKDSCGKCGAVREDSQLGLEPTPEQYTENLVAVFREVRRVLKPSGTVWLNLGDTYSSGFMNGKQGAGSWVSHVGNTTQGRITTQRREPPAGLKVKDLVGIPWRVAFALQADGWYLRSDIIWSKPNPMPESVTDRPTKAHEYVFLLTKSARYFFDQDAVREPHVRVWDPSARNGSINARRDDASGIEPNPAGRNLRSVWTIATRPYPGAHFAVFPPELPERCIKAGCPENGVVLDPFAGSGTVGMVANRLSRRAILIDLNAEYLKQQMRRNTQTPLGLGGAAL